MERDRLEQVCTALSRTCLDALAEGMDAEDLLTCLAISTGHVLSLLAVHQGSLRDEMVGTQKWYHTLLWKHTQAMVHDHDSGRWEQEGDPETA